MFVSEEFVEEFFEKSLCLSQKNLLNSSLRRVCVCLGKVC